MKKIIALTLILLNAFQVMIGMEQDEQTITIDYISELPNEVKLHILNLGMSDIIKSSSIFSPYKEAGVYIYNVALICKCFSEFSDKLYNTAEIMVKKHFADEESFLCEAGLQDQLDDELTNILVDSHTENEEQAARLIIAGADVDIYYKKRIGNSSHRGPLRHIMIKIVETGEFKNLIPLMIHHGSNIKVLNEEGDSLIIIATKLAIKSKSDEVLKILIENGVDVNTKSKYGFGASAVSIAGREGHFNLVGLLKSAKSKIINDKTDTWNLVSPLILSFFNY